MVQNAKGEIKIFLDRCSVIAGAVERDSPKKILHHDKIGNNFLLAYDETKRMLVVCAAEKVSRRLDLGNIADPEYSIHFTSSFSTKDIRLFKGWAHR